MSSGVAEPGFRVSKAIHDIDILTHRQLVIMVQLLYMITTRAICEVWETTQYQCLDALAQTRKLLAKYSPANYRSQCAARGSIMGISRCLLGCGRSNVDATCRTTLLTVKLLSNQTFATYYV